MRDFDMDGVVTLRLPARLRSRRENDMWFLFDPGGAPGRIWADYDILEADQHGGRSPFELAEIYARDWPADEQMRPVSRQLVAAPLGAILTVVEEDIDEGGDDDPPLRHVTWLYFADLRERRLMATFRLMHPRRLADDPAVASLQALLGREVRALRVGEESSA
jgi:hypothetical protein